MYYVMSCCGYSLMTGSDGMGFLKIPWITQGSMSDTNLDDLEGAVAHASLHARCCCSWVGTLIELGAVAHIGDSMLKRRVHSFVLMSLYLAICKSVHKDTAYDDWRADPTFL